MRHVVGYDLENGIIKEHVKMKPDVGIKGSITVQLFDERGGLLREIKTENRITDSISKMAFMDYFCHRIRGNPWGRQWEYNDAEVGSNPTNKDNNYRESHGSFAYFTAPFVQMFLSDDTSPEAPFERSIKGNIIGWADKVRPYAGSSTTKGTINLSESSFSENNLHFVFDFPTSVANGTFQKIWWGNMRLNNVQEEFIGLNPVSRNFKLDGYSSFVFDTPPPSDLTPSQTRLSYTHYPRIFKYQGKLYAIGNNHNTGRLCMAISNLTTGEYSEIDLHSIMEIPTTSFRANHWMMAQDHNFVYIFYHNNNTRLHRLNLNDFTHSEIILSTNYRTLIGEQIPEIPSNWYGSIDGNLHAGMIGFKNGRFYIPLRYNSGAVDKTFILVCMPDENLTKTALIDLSLEDHPEGPFVNDASGLNGYHLRIQPRDTDTWFVCNGSYTFITDNNFNIIDIMYRNFSFHYDHYLEDTGGAAIKRYYSSRSNNYIHRYGYSYLLWEPIAASTLLPNPVTKTPTNTMKIQYDFNIQRQDPFMP